MVKNEHLYSLDLFRGFCGYGVAICHLQAFLFENIFMEYLSLLFVEFFFVLSGFVLYPQLIRVISKKKNLIIFYKRRWIRTLPLYVVILLLVSILTGELFSKDFFKYLLFIQKAIPNFINHDYYPVAWSLSIEELFYLIFPIILINLNLKNFLKVSLLIFAIILLVKLFLSPQVDANFYRTGTFLRFDAILLGFILAHFKNQIFYNKKIFILVFLSGITFYLYNINFFIENQNETLVKFFFIILLQILSSTILVIFIYLEPFLISKGVKNFSLLISQQTYSIYLLHMIFIYTFEKINFSQTTTSFLYIFSLFLSSILIFNFFEKPLLRLRPKIQ